MKHLFVINPAAGKGTALEYVLKIEKIFRNRSDEYIIKITEKPRHAIDIVREYVSLEDYRVYAIGGDGTLNEVLNGVVGSGSSLGVIPGGSGNDFIRSMNLKKSEDLLQRTIDGEEKLVDLARVNGRYFINIASVGIDAEIGFNAARYKKIPFLPGHLSYLLSIFTTIFSYKSGRMNIRLDGREFSAETLLMACANGKYYGGGMKVAPEAELEDGLLDICHVKDLSKLKILTMFPKVIQGSHSSIREVSFYRTSCLEVLADEEMTLNIDGEFLKTRTAKFEIIPRGIKLILPQNRI